jgi:hypothetical protein
MKGQKNKRNQIRRDREREREIENGLKAHQSVE